MPAPVLAVLAVLLLAASTAHAQYAETPRRLPVANGGIYSAAQIGNRLFIAGIFSRVSDPTGSAILVDHAGALVTGAFPTFTGVVHQVVPDGLGGFLVAGNFTAVDGRPIARLTRVAPDRTIDLRYQVRTDGAIRIVILAHGRIYLAGDFTSVNGAPRRGLAVLDAASAQLTSLGAGVNPSGLTIRALTVSSTGIYAAANTRVWGFDAASGALLFERELFGVNALAATSQRVYVGTFGGGRPLAAINPRTGEDLSWAPALQFVPISGTYGDNTSISALRLDGGRLYFAGLFRTVDGRANLSTVDAETGQALAWRPSDAPVAISSLTRIGPAIVATFASFNSPLAVRKISAFNVDTAALEPWHPQPFGSIHAVAAAHDGIVIGGDFNGIGGDARDSIASIDLDTGAVEPWTVTGISGSAIAGPLDIVTDGANLIASYNARTLVKIDAASGAVLAQLDLDPGSSLRVEVAGSRVVAAQTRQSGGPRLSAVTIADWSRQDLPTVFAPNSVLHSLAIAGEVAYVAGSFTSVDGVRRHGLAAVNLITGALEPWNPSPDGTVQWLRGAAGRVWAAGSFRRIGAAWRRGVAELDPVTGLASSWHPDLPVGFARHGTDRIVFTSIVDMDIGPDGNVYVSVSGVPAPAVSGQPVDGGIVAISTATGRRLSWRPPVSDWIAILPDCLLQSTGCLRPALSPPSDLRVEQAGGSVSLHWTLPAGDPVRTALRLEVGTAEGRTDLLALDLQPGQTSYSANVPRGAYVARLRSVAGAEVSLPTPDVSFAIGPPDVPAAPLDLTAITDRNRVTLAWRPPSNGVPQGYIFEAGSAPGGREAAFPVAGSATSLVIEAPPGRYHGRLVPVNANGRGPVSNEVTIDVNTLVGSCLQEPDPPSDLTAQISGHSVSLSWRLAEVGSPVYDQLLLAGSAPGLQDLDAIPLVSWAESYTATVPPGTYYLRIRARNDCGLSGFSNEVQVVVGQ